MRNEAIDETDDGGADRQFVTALARGLCILQAFRPEDDKVSNAELARRTGLPKPTISRLTYTLGKLGYLSPSRHGDGFRLHPHVLSLGYPVLSRLDIRQIAHPLMQDLADECHVTVTLALRDGLNMIFIERAKMSSEASVPQDIGSLTQIANTSMGRAYLAGLPGPERDQLLEELRKSGSAEWWRQMRSGITRELKRFQERGFCMSIGEWDRAVNAVSVPLQLPNRPLLCITCGGYSVRVPREKLEVIGDKAKQLAQKIQRSFAG